MNNAVTTTRGALSTMIAGRSIWVRLWHMRLLRAALMLAPTLIAGVYYYFIAANQYESETQFVVRSASRPEMPSGLAFLVQLGFGRSQDDSFIVQNFIISRDAVQRLQEALPFRAMFGRKEADALARYPSPFFGTSDEQFFRYYKRMVTISHADKTGISTLKVKAFEPKDAYQITMALLRLAEDFINHLNQRLQADAVRNSLADLHAAQQRLIEAQSALTDFRNHELIVDPVSNAVALGELIAQMAAELGVTQAQISEMKVGSTSSPQLYGLQRKANALGEQIGRERARIAGDSGGLASRIAKYERLNLEREFAKEMASSAEKELLRTRTDATRQLLYLERVVEPHLPDYPLFPKRTRIVLTFAAANILALLILWLIYSGIREHNVSK